MFTRDELISFFETRYTAEQIMEALRILSESNPEIDPNAEQFSAEITEELEKIFDAVGVALDKQKALPESQKSDAIAVLEATQLASSVSFANPEMMAAMIRLTVQGAVDQASSLVQLRAKVTQEVLKQGNLEIAKAMLQEAEQTSGYLRSLSSDNDKVDGLLAQYGVGTVKNDLVDRFLAEVKSGASQAKQSVSNSQSAINKIGTKQESFDIDAFLSEV